MILFFVPYGLYIVHDAKKVVSRARPNPHPDGGWVWLARLAQKIFGQVWKRASIGCIGIGESIVYRARICCYRTEVL